MAVLPCAMLCRRCGRCGLTAARDNLPTAMTGHGNRHGTCDKPASMWQNRTFPRAESKGEWFMAPMGPGGRSGTSDVDMSKMLNKDIGALPRDMATDALGEPVGVVNVVTLDTTEPTLAGRIALGEMFQPGWFRWWHIPAATLPLALGTTATVLLLRRRQQQMPISTYNRLISQGRGRWDQILRHRATQNAVDSFQHGAKTLRGTAQRVPVEAALLRERYGKLLAAATATVAASAAARRASESAESALDAMTTLWNSRMPKAWQVRRSSKKRTGALTAPLNSVRLGLLDALGNIQAEKRLM